MKLVIKEREFNIAGQLMCDYYYTFNDFLQRLEKLKSLPETRVVYTNDDLITIITDLSTYKYYPVIDIT